MNPTVIITGVSGLLGKAITSRLAQNYNIIGLDQDEPAFIEIMHDFISVDLTDAQAIDSTLDKIIANGTSEIYSVIHLAAYYDFSGEPSRLYNDLTVNGTKNLLNSLNKKNIKVGQFIFSSTHLVMKPKEKGEEISEFDELEADWQYPQSKIDAENIIKLQRKQIPVVMLRISGAYDEFGHSPPICQQIKRIYEHQFESFFYPGDEHKGQPYVHIEDIAKSFECCLGKRNSLGEEEVFLIASQNFLTYKQLQDRIGQLLYGTKWATLFLPKLIAKAGAWFKNLSDEDNEFIKPWMIDQTDAHYPVSSKLANDKLEWFSKHNLYDDLGAMIDNLLLYPEKWYRENDLGQPPPVDIRILSELKKRRDVKNDGNQSSSTMGL